MIVVYVILTGISLVAFIILIRQTPSRKKKGDDVLLPLSTLLTESTASKLLLSFDFTSKLEGSFEGRHVCAQVDLGRQGFQGQLHISMKGLSRFLKQPLIMSEYPQVIGNVIHKGQQVELSFPLSNFETDFYLNCLKDLSASCEKLEDDYKGNG